MIILTRGLLQSSNLHQNKLAGALPLTPLGELTALPQNP